MSTTYSYTRNMYDPITDWPAWIIMPEDGDPFLAQSANIFEKALLDRNMYAFEAFAKLPSSNSTIKASSSDGLTINMNPVIVQAVLAGNYYLYTSQTTVSLSASNLEPAGSFAANTWYYVYLKALTANTFSFVIKTDAPDKYLLWKDNMGTSDTSYKYLLSFRTDNTSKIFPFVKVGTKMHYSIIRNALTNGTAAMATDISMLPFMPPHSTQIYLKITYSNTGMALGGGYVHSPSGTFFVNVSPGTFQTQLDFTVDALQNLSYMVNTPASMTIDILGYSD